MAVLKSKNNRELIISCRCGCDEGVHIKISNDGDDYYAYQCFTNGNFYKEQYGMLGSLNRKLKKIWAIIWIKDYYYSDVVMSKEEFQEFKEWVNQFGE